MSKEGPLQNLFRRATKAIGETLRESENVRRIEAKIQDAKPKVEEIKQGVNVARGKAADALGWLSKVIRPKK